MKPFNLKEALAGNAVLLRDGRRAYVRYHETLLLVEEDRTLFGYTADGTDVTWCTDGCWSARTRSSEDIIGMYPQIRIINGFEVPVPETEAPECGEYYFVVDINHVDFCYNMCWRGSNYDLRMLERGLVFLNEEDAIATATALLSRNQDNKDEL